MNEDITNKKTEKPKQESKKENIYSYILGGSMVKHIKWLSLSNKYTVFEIQFRSVNYTLEKWKMSHMEEEQVVFEQLLLKDFIM